MSAVEGRITPRSGRGGSGYVPRLMGVGARWLSEDHTLIRIALRFRWFTVIVDVAPTGVWRTPRVIRHRAGD